LLLEHLLEQEKREQERQTGQTSDMPPQDTNSGLLTDRDFERMRVDVLNAGPQRLSAKGLLPLQHPTTTSQMSQHGGIRQKFLSRGVNQPQWRLNMTVPMQMGNNIQQSMPRQANMEGSMIRKEG
jgi:hypothetical protein